jgi:hypothetical protein
MLENLRKQGASAFIWIVFAILIGMFVVNFGQQSAGAQGGCHLSSGKRTALKVGRAELDDTALRLAINLGAMLERGGQSELQTRRAMERLIVREILAGEAERRGLRVSGDLVDDAIHHGKLHFTGQVIPAPSLFFAMDEEVPDANPGAACTKDTDCKGDLLCKEARCQYMFDDDRFKRLLRNWGISIGVYKREQAREVLASTMARILTHEVPASRDEALSQYISENTRVSFNSVRFDASKYADALHITDHDLDRFIHGHPTEVTAAYQADAWKGKKQVHLRRIFVPKSELPPAPNPTAQPVDGGNGPAPIPPSPPDPVKAKLAALQAQIAAGKRGFIEVAEATESNPQLAARGGDWGWYDEGTWTLSEPALNDAAAKLVQGKVSDVIEASDGFYLLLIDDRREGDLTFEQVQRELALPMARSVWGKEAARRAALAALAEAKKGKSLAELFPGEKTGLAPAPLTMISDRPVVWGQAGDTSGSGTAAPAAPAAPAAGSGAAEAPPASGSAAGTPGAPGAGAGSGAAGTTPPAGPPPMMLPSADTLPSMAPVEKPVVERHDGMVRSGDQTPIGDSAELVTALFDELAVGTVADRVFEVRASVIDPMPQYALVQVTAKDLADVAEFEKQADRLVDRLATIRGIQLFTEWLRERCTSMAKDGKLKPTWAYLQQFDDQGRKEPITYQPCESLLAR